MRLAEKSDKSTPIQLQKIAMADFLRTEAELSESRRLFLPIIDKVRSTRAKRSRIDAAKAQAAALTTTAEFHKNALTALEVIFDGLNKWHFFKHIEIKKKIAIAKGASVAAARAVEVNTKVAKQAFDQVAADRNEAHYRSLYDPHPEIRTYANAPYFFTLLGLSQTHYIFSHYEKI